MCDFKDAKVGDRVWHAMWGWGTIDDIRHGNKKPIFVQFPTHREEFRTDGTLYSSDIYSVLFWDEVKIVPPPHPKRKVRKVMRGEIDICRCGRVMSVLGDEGVLSVYPGGKEDHCSHDGPHEVLIFRHEYEEFE